MSHPLSATPQIITAKVTAKSTSVTPCVCVSSAFAASPARAASRGQTESHILSMWTNPALSLIHI
eukprot:2070809-Pyramimonas_sp.AAC.1